MKRYGDQFVARMIAAVGHGVAMADAPAELTARARYVAPSILQEGAAAIIEALVTARPGSAVANARRFAVDGVG